MANKFYVVWVGRQSGIFSTWKEAEAQVSNFPQAKYKSFSSENEAKEAFSKDYKDVLNFIKKDKDASTKPIVKTTALEDMNIHIYCDGGCEPNPGEASSGVSVYENNILIGLYYGLYNSNGTNNSAELNALHKALLIAHENIKNKKTVQILCDSMYAIDCITKWAFSWKLKNWVKPSGEIKNLDIIKEAHSLFVELKDKVVVSHIKAHSGFEGNELADRMSILGISNKETNFTKLEQPYDIDKLLKLREG